MIYVQTKLKIIDNTGATKGQCIKIFKGPYGSIGDTILITVKEVHQKKLKKTKITKGGVFKALILQTVSNHKDINQHFIQFDVNSVVLLDSQQKPLGTRIFGPVSSEFRKKKYFKILSMASNII